MKRLLFVMLIVAVLAGVLAPAAAASGSAQTVAYVVKPNDTLGSIARQFCTTWQHVYHINRAVIGPNPNVLRSGTVLQVPNQCGGQTQPPAPCNLGPIPHAMGPLAGNVYTVVAGDTLFSIARRFCTSVEQLAASNGIRHPWRIHVNQRLVVPVGSTTPTPTPTPPAQRTLTINVPQPNAVLGATFTASGTGSGLFEGNVVVTAFTSAGVQLARTATTLQGANVGTGGAGTWTATLTVSAPPGTPGFIEASSPQSNVPAARVNVIYGQTTPTPLPSYRTFAPGECQIQGLPGAALHAFPGGPIITTFPSGTVFNALSGARINNQYWYEIVIGSLRPWAPMASIANTFGVCTW